MPNHIYSQLKIEGSAKDIQELIDFVRDGDRIMSADKIVPMPPELRMVSSPIRIVNEEEYETWKAKPKTCFMDNFGPLTERMQKDYIKRFGATDWYTWATTNWGTKWDFYDASEWDVKLDSATISFQTAWSPASPVMAKLAFIFPKLKLTYHYADEGGNFVGNQIYEKGGSIEENDFEWKSPEGIEVQKLVGYWFEDEDEETEEE